MRFRQILIYLAMFAVLLAGCGTQAPIQIQSVDQTPQGWAATTSPTHGESALNAATSVPARNAAENSSPTPEPINTPIANAMRLDIVEHKIIGAIELEPLAFQPEHGSQEAVLARHASEKQPRYRMIRKLEGSSPVLYPVSGGEGYNASEHVRQEGSTTQTWVQLELDGKVLLEVNVGNPSPIDPLQGLWVDQTGGWVLEIAHITNTTQRSGIQSEVTGQIYQNGELLNQKLGYEEMFGYQLLDGKPFYFYKSDGLISLSYDGQALPLTYDEIPHYGCCSAAAMNPTAAPNWVGFFGRRGEDWFYTEIGIFD